LEGRRHSRAFDEYITKMVDEILLDNEEYLTLNARILEAEEKVKAKFKDDIEDFLLYESLIIEQQELSNSIITKICLFKN
jgi:hypothetical protein